jgi:hypothetical protein
VQRFYLDFIVNEAWAAGTSLFVYFLFRLVAFVVSLINGVLPIHYEAPAGFLEFVLSWGAAIGGSATFLVITVYHVYALARNLSSSEPLNDP